MNALVARIGDRANPVLVKEVRAALRGRFFRVSFSIVIVLATIATLVVLSVSALDDGRPSGPALFAALSMCASVGVNLLVPFSAMLSMTGEQDENTLELLQLSGLRGWSIVGGKLASSLVQSLVVLAAFLPFLTFAFLLQGVGIELVVAATTFMLATSALQSSLGIFLGSLARARWARVVLLVLFGFFLLQSSQFGAILAVGVLFGGPSAFGSAHLTSVPIATFLATATGTLAFLAMASGRMTHREENQSSPVRFAVSGILAFAIATAAFMSTYAESARILALAFVLVALPMMFLVTERERLPRAVAARPPRWARAIPFASAWLPGGARGAVFVVLHVLAVAAAAVVLGLRSGTRHEVGFVLVELVVALVFLLVVPGVLSPINTGDQKRILVRVLTFFAFVAANVGVVVLASLAGDMSIADLCPVAMPFQVGADGLPTRGGQTVLLVASAGLALAVNVPRVVAARAEWRAALKQSASRPVDAADAGGSRAAPGT